VWGRGEEGQPSAARDLAQAAAGGRTVATATNPVHCRACRTLAPISLGGWRPCPRLTRLLCVSCTLRSFPTASGEWPRCACCLLLLQRLPQRLLLLLLLLLPLHARCAAAPSRPAAAPAPPAPGSLPPRLPGSTLGTSTGCAWTRSWAAGWSEALPGLARCACLDERALRAYARVAREPRGRCGGGSGSAEATSHPASQGCCRCRLARQRLYIF
jgi:hypothetical protein